MQISEKDFTSRYNTVPLLCACQATTQQRRSYLTTTRSAVAGRDGKRPLASFLEAVRMVGVAAASKPLSLSTADLPSDREDEPEGWIGLACWICRFCCFGKVHTFRLILSCCASWAARLDGAQGRANAKFSSSNCNGRSPQSPQTVNAERSQGWTA